MGHTPGPWWVEEPNDPAEDDRQISDGFGNTATVYGDADTATANANLIAAAPELLDAIRLCKQALKNYIDSGYDEEEDQEAYVAALKAIAKAEGRSE